MNNCGSFHHLHAFCTFTRVADAVPYLLLRCHLYNLSRLTHRQKHSHIRCLSYQQYHCRSKKCKVSDHPFKNLAIFVSMDRQFEETWKMLSGVASPSVLLWRVRVSGICPLLVGNLKKGWNKFISSLSLIMTSHKMALVGGLYG